MNGVVRQPSARVRMQAARQVHAKNGTIKCQERVDVFSYSALWLGADAQAQQGVYGKVSVCWGRVCESDASSAGARQSVLSIDGESGFIGSPSHGHVGQAILLEGRCRQKAIAPVVAWPAGNPDVPGVRVERPSQAVNRIPSPLHQRVWRKLGLSGPFNVACFLSPVKREWVPERFGEYVPHG